jgi:hypothetical protein
MVEMDRAPMSYYSPYRLEETYLAAPGKRFAARVKDTTGPLVTLQGTAKRNSFANRGLKGLRVGDRSRVRFLTPADSPLHDCSPCSHVHARRESFGIRPSFAPHANPNVAIRDFCVAVSRRSVSHRPPACCGRTRDGGAPAGREYTVTNQCGRSPPLSASTKPRLSAGTPSSSTRRPHAPANKAPAKKASPLPLARPGEIQR